jgi:hypothetical protein
MEFYGGKQQDDNGDILESNETRFSFFLRLLSRPGIPRYHPSGISHVHGTPMVPMAPPKFGKTPAAECRITNEN